MKERLELDRLIEAERQAAPPSTSVEQGWQRLSETLATGASVPLPVPLDGPLRLQAAGLATKSVAIMAIVGAGAVGVGGWVAASALSTDEPAELGRAAPAAERAEQTSRLGPAPAAIEQESSSEGPAAPSAEQQADSSRTGISRRNGEALPLGSAASSLDSGQGFDEELALIKRAKAALDCGQTQAGLAALAEHARRFPRGVFAGEREALRVLAACKGGPSAHGRRAALRFLRSHPGSPVVDRVRRACGLNGTLTDE
jgi:hypothetical protein